MNWPNRPYSEWTIVERLRYKVKIHEIMGEGNNEFVDLLREAADTIEKLQNKLEELHD